MPLCVCVCVCARVHTCSVCYLGVMSVSGTLNSSLWLCLNLRYTAWDVLSLLGVGLLCTHDVHHVRF